MKLQAYFDHFLYMIRVHGRIDLRCPIDSGEPRRMYEEFRAVVQNRPLEDWEVWFRFIRDGYGVQYSLENCHPLVTIEDDLDMDNAYLFIGEFFEEQENLTGDLKEYFDKLCEMSEEYDKKHYPMEPDPVMDLILSVPKPDERPEDFNPGDHFGGNYDDAYNGGFTDGEAYGRYQLAQEIIRKMIREEFPPTSPTTHEP